MEKYGNGFGMDTDDRRSNASNSNSQVVNVSQYDVMFGEHMETYSVEVFLSYLYTI